MLFDTKYGMEYIAKKKREDSTLEEIKIDSCSCSLIPFHLFCFVPTWLAAAGAGKELELRQGLPTSNIVIRRVY